MRCPKGQKKVVKNKKKRCVDITPPPPPPEPVVSAFVHKPVDGPASTTVPSEFVEIQPVVEGDPLAQQISQAATASAPTAPPAPSAWLRTVLLAAIGLSVLLIGVAAVPPWAVRDGPVAAFLVNWRVHVAAAGLSTLFAAAIVLVIGSSTI